MATPDRETINTFISITGSSEEVAVQRLEEYKGDLHRAVNAHFSEGSRNLVQAASASDAENNLMDVDQPAEIVDVTDSVQAQGPATRGTVIIDDDDDDNLSDSRSNYVGQTDQGDQTYYSHTRPRAPASDGVPGDRNDIEEQMIRAAIEASKNDAELQVDHDLTNASLGSESNLEDDELPPLVRNRSTRMASASVNPLEESAGTESNHPLSYPDHADGDQPQINENALQSDEWGGMSSMERDEAMMLEAAMFGGIPEEGLPYAAQRFDRPWRAPRPPSPGLTAQRLIREQQDDEYLAALQADRERELKALEEERVAEEAALAEERRKEEEARRKIEEDQELERLLAAKEASLPKEPAADDDNTVTLLVRMPDGSRHGRRFLRSDKLQSLYDFVDVGRLVKPGTYRVVRPYPRRPFSEGESSSTLIDLGLTSKQEALYLEPI